VWRSGQETPLQGNPPNKPKPKKKKTSRDLLPIRLPHQVTHQEPSLLARIRVENTQHPLRSEPEHCTRDSLQSSNRRIAQNQKQKRAGHELPLLKSGSFSITCRNQRGRAARANRGWANPETGIKIEPFCRRKSRGSRRSLPPPSLPPFPLPSNASREKHHHLDRTIKIAASVRAGHYKNQLHHRREQAERQLSSSRLGLTSYSGEPTASRRRRRGSSGAEEREKEWPPPPPSDLPCSDKQQVQKKPHSFANQSRELLSEEEASLPGPARIL
jgi:hypothetical protein